jgi:hypothetical protein
MKGLCGRYVGTYGGVYNFSVEQVTTHSSSRVDAIFAHFKAKVGGHVVRLHHRFTKGVEHRLYVCRD